MFKLEKDVWTESDFKVMGWHDSQIYSFYANDETFEWYVDLDYIFKWVNPESEGDSYQFYVAPVTMVFENSHSVKIDIKSEQGLIEIADLHMENPKLTPNGKFTQHEFRFECQEGEIVVTATGFKMYVRMPPKLTKYQCLTFEQRGGISFGKEVKAL
ncbi:hypothetical protein HUZ36_19000 [Pseudoalteromonas sp. McH1-7]|uniref:hypothetical protein n=1 Tax=Pseudoalteromonas sp. McH1-7 TaxID=2745574 RepID=UPI0015915A9E|nr:hypothetical protein [Pseudoalteromonas sp. McH1-7]NUZ12866.1 hypothetical protein [Pseudoalteromonas sp. McH1-7]NUZ12871.1 hypothetical protein [Pseudoalteromonas sp. McH1-7]